MTPAPMGRSDGPDHRHRWRVERVHLDLDAAGEGGQSLGVRIGAPGMRVGGSKSAWVGSAAAGWAVNSPGTYQAGASSGRTERAQASTDPKRVTITRVTTPSLGRIGRVSMKTLLKILPRKSFHRQGIPDSILINGLLAELGMKT